MGLNIPASQLSHNLDERIQLYKPDEIAELFKKKKTEHLYWPWQLSYREAILLNTASVERTARNMVGFMTLFPSIGGVLEEQSKAHRALLMSERMATEISTPMRKKLYPYNWGEVGNLSMDLLQTVNIAVTQGVIALQKNNYPVLEQGIRRSEFDAMRKFVLRPSFSSLPEQLKDGELFMRTITHGNAVKLEETIREWRDIVTLYLRDKYGENGSDWQRRHLETVNTLPPGALYAYIWVLVIAEQQNMDPRGKSYRAVNPPDWLDYKKAEYAEQLKITRMREQK